ncbi:hypothetical protein [Dactylosporangium sp. NPDC006015]
MTVTAEPQCQTGGMSGCHDRQPDPVFDRSETQPDTIAEYYWNVHIA